jgi:hypothetical protein
MAKKVAVSFSPPSTDFRCLFCPDHGIIGVKFALPG